MKSYDKSEAAYGLLFVVSDSVFGLRWLIGDDKIGVFQYPDAQYRAGDKALCSSACVCVKKNIKPWVFETGSLWPSEKT